MVGEVRDAPTAELAVRAALTAPCAFIPSSNDAVSVIPRLRNMGVESYLLAAVLRGAMAQRLVRRACAACSKAGKPTSEERKLLSRQGLSAKSLKRGRGCDACGGTGFKGRTAIVEAFVSDQTVEGNDPRRRAYIRHRELFEHARLQDLVSQWDAGGDRGINDHDGSGKHGDVLMPVYVCRVSDEKGKVEEFLREAVSEEPLLRELSSERRFVLSLKELAVGEAAPEVGRRYSRKEVEELTDLLTLMLGSGFSLKDALDVAQTVTKRGPGNDLVALLLERIRKGSTFAAALDGGGSSFPPVYRGLVRIGERIGSLDQVFVRLSSFWAIRKSYGSDSPRPSCILSW